MEETPPTRLGNPLSWGNADRCFAIAVLLAVACAGLLLITLIGGWPFLPFPARAAPDLPLAQALITSAWVVCAVVARRARGREGHGRGLIALIVFMYAATLASFTMLIGPFAAPGWCAMVGGGVVGYVLFPRWIALAGLGFYALLVIGCALVVGAHAWPVLDGFAPPSAFAGLDAAEVARRATASVAMSALTFSVIAWVVDRWRDREARYQRLASTDALTGLTNRRRFLEIAGRGSRDRGDTARRWRWC